MQLKGLGELKNPMTSLGIKPVTVWLSAYCLNQLFYCMPLHPDHSMTNCVLLITQLCVADGNFIKP
jgi:hypothetical protein